jgi:glycosyltransferase involved in cell wall biosynthesis
MKILNVIGSVNVANGGTTNHVFSLSRVWSRLGHECHVLCLDAHDADCVASSPIKTFALGGKISQSSPAWRLPFVRYGYTPALGRWLKRNAKNYDAVILNGLWNYTSVGTARALKGTGVPYFICPHGMLDPWLKTADRLRYFARAMFWHLFEARVIRGARGIIFACEEEKRLAYEGFLEERKNAYVVGYGVEDISYHNESARHHPVQNPLYKPGRRLILFLGRVDKKKGLDILLRAFNEIKDSYPQHDLMIVGPDESDWARKLKKLTSELGICPRVHWMGMRVGREKMLAYTQAEFFVLPSHQENFGLAVAEAMALSLPVLITSKVNIWREVTAARAGLATDDNVDGIKAGLEKMCSLSREDRTIMAQNARGCFIQRFDLEKNAGKMLGLILELCRRPELRKTRKDHRSQISIAH